MADLEQIRGRLTNIRTVQPILGALRTISLGSWQAALSRRSSLRRYVAHLQSLVPLFVAAIEEGGMGKGLDTHGNRGLGDSSELRAHVLLAVGSERGLCGRFNQEVAEQVGAYLEQQRSRGGRVELMVLGSRLSRVLKRRGLTAVWEAALPTSALPPFSLARTLTRQWLERYEAFSLDAVAIVSNTYRGVGRYETVTRQIIPLDMDLATEDAEPEWTAETSAMLVIIETDPWSLYTRVVEQLLMVRCYSYLLESATAEHATRYQLMEGAAQNADHLMDDLTSELQALRRQAITREMQELAVGAGLLKR